MASSVAENVIRWGKKLERYTDEAMILGVIHKLSKVPVTVDLLQETGIGKVVRGLAKKPGKIGEKASTVLHNWRKVVANAQKIEIPSYEKPSSNKEKRSHTETNPKYGHESKSSYSKSEHNFSSSNYTNKEESNGELFYPDIEIRTKESAKTSSGGHLERKHKSSSSEDIHIKHKKQKLSPSLEKSSHGNSSDKEKVKKNSNESSKDSHKHGSKSHDKKHKDSKKSKDSDKKSSSSVKKHTGKVESATDAFTSSEGLFDDCLSFNVIVPVKRKKSSKSSSSASSGSKTVSHDDLPKEKTKSKSSKHKSSEKKSKSHSSVKDESKPKEVSSKTEKSEPLLTLKENPCIASSLPQPQLNYRPLPRNYDYSCFPVKRKALTNEDAIMFTSSKKEKTVVYSGRRNFLTAVPTLQESCTRILIEHIDAIEYVGGLPYYLLKPVLERCTPQQLLNIEDYNPALLEDTRELWEIHCKKDFRTHKPEENETWRDLYLRAFEEREKRLKAITRNISASMTKSTTASRSVKLTYVDSYVKPPRDVARKQEKNGTGLPVNHSLKVGPPSKASPRPTAPAINSAAVSNSKSDYVPKSAKPKVAPLMAKTLKSMKQCFRR